MLRVRFTTWEQYLEAWRYCMHVGTGFDYSNNREDLWIAPIQYGDEDDATTMDRLREIRDK